MRTAKWFFLLLLIFSAGARAQAPASPANSLPFLLKPLGHNVWAAIDDAKGSAGANAGFVIGDDGVAVIDTFENPEAARQLLAEIRKLTKLPVKFVINTHYHLDHVAGNRVFRDAGAVVIAQRNVYAWIRTENLKFFGKDIKPEQKAMVEGLAAPEILYDTELRIFLGSREIRVNYYPGHTGGDSVVSIPDAQVAFCGDLFWRQTLPNLIDASTKSWIETLNFFSDAQPSMTFVPGHGDIGNVSDLRDFRDYLKNLRAMVAQPGKEGKTGDDLVNAVMPAVKEKYGKWEFFDYFAKSNILDMAAEIRGDKRIPQPAVKP
jgi:cyclase